MVVYQIYPRSFQDADGDGEGDLAGITERLDHLAWLGVDALWLSPIFCSPMADGGYDVSDFDHVDPRFGTDADLDALIARAHALGLKVLLDIVPCHTSIEHLWFREHPERYTWSPVDGPPNNWRANFGGPAWSPDPHGRGWYGHSYYPEQPDLDWSQPDVAQAMGDVLRRWRARGVDGFRLDALQQLAKDPELRDDPPATRPPVFETNPDYDGLQHVHSSNGPGAAAAVRALRAAAGDDALLVGEVFLPRAAKAAYAGDLDATFVFELFFARWDAASLAAALHHPKPAWVLANHDFPRLADRVGEANVRAAALLLLALPGIAVIYQGDEIGQRDGPPSTRHDRAGRDPHRRPMQWAPGPAGGFTSATPWLDPVDPATRNVRDQREDPASLLCLYRELLSVRRGLDGEVEDVQAADGVLRFRRGRHVVAVNTGGEDRSLGAGDVVLATHPHVARVLPGGSAVILQVGQIV